MWKIKQILICVAVLGTHWGLRAHPVSVMTGDAIWAENQLIINMQMTMDNLLLHFQIPVDENGYLSNNYLYAAILDFEKLVASNFEIKTPQIIAPQVSLSPFLRKLPGKIKRAELREFSIEFELRFICQNPSSQITFTQTMGDRARGLQSTLLITFYFGGVPQLVPVYNNIGIKLDLEKQMVLEEKLVPIVQVGKGEIEVFLPYDWIAHGFPFDLEAGDSIISGIPIKDGEVEAGWSEFIFYLPDNARDFHIKWNSFSWQMRRINMIIKNDQSEKTVTLSRFNPDFAMEL